MPVRVKKFHDRSRILLRQKAGVYASTLTALVNICAWLQTNISVNVL